MRIGYLLGLILIPIFRESSPFYLVDINNIMKEINDEEKDMFNYVRIVGISQLRLILLAKKLAASNDSSFQGKDGKEVNKSNGEPCPLKTPTPA